MFSIISGSVPFFFFADFHRTKRLWQGHDRHHQNCDDTQSHCHMLLQIPRRLPDFPSWKKNCEGANFEGWRLQVMCSSKSTKMLWEGWFNLKTYQKMSGVFFSFPANFHLLKVRSIVWRPKNFEKWKSEICILSKTRKGIFCIRCHQHTDHKSNAHNRGANAWDEMSPGMAKTPWCSSSSKALSPKSMTKNMTIGVKKLFKDLSPAKPLPRHKTQTQKLRRIKSGWRAGHTTESFVHVPADFSPSVRTSKVLSLLYIWTPSIMSFSNQQVLHIIPKNPTNRIRKYKYLHNPFLTLCCWDNVNLT